MRVKLLFPPVFPRNKQFSPPASIPSLTASLREHGIEVSQDDLLIKVRDYNSGAKDPIPLRVFKDKKRVLAYLSGGEDDEFDSVLARIVSATDITGYGLIGFGAISRFQFQFALLLSTFLKRTMEVPIVIGGAHLGAFPVERFAEIDWVDYLVVGEGEEAIVRLVEALQGKRSLDSVPGLVYRDEGEIRSNKPGNFPVSEIAMPDYSDYPIGLYLSFSQGEQSLAYQVSRGCPNACSFCSLPVLPYEEKPVRKVVKELMELKRLYGISHFNFVDRTFNADPNYVRSFCHAVIDSGISWDAYARAEKLDFPLLCLMKQAGCEYLRYGIESGSKRLLKKMNKQISITDASRVLKDTSDAGIRNVVYLIAGFPGETNRDREETTAFIRRHANHISTLGIHRFRVFGGATTSKAASHFGLSEVSSDLFGVYSFEFSGKEKEKEIRRSYENIVLAFYKHVVKRKNPLFRFVPDGVTSYLLKRKPGSYRRRLTSC